MRPRARPGLRLADPRVIVGAGFLILVIAVASTASVLARRAADTRDAVLHIAVSVEVPLDHLGDVLEADTAGEASLQRAVTATGDERNALLADSIAQAETAARAWSSYRASALELPGETALAAKYERDYAAGRAIAARVLVPIVQSTVPTPLPADQVAAAELDRHDLLALRDLYTREDHITLDSLDRAHVQERDDVVIVAGGLIVALLIACGLAMRGANRAVARARQHAAAAALNGFERTLTRAMDFADTERSAYRVAVRALTDSAEGASVSIAAETSNSTANGVGTPPACVIDAAEHCPALSFAVPMQFSDAAALDACPALHPGAGVSTSLTCVPVSVAGVPIAVVQLRGDVGNPPELDNETVLIIRRLDHRITAIRALAQVQHQASHDPLTGLLNRRSLEETAVKLTEDRESFAVAYADLDHFKRLNDNHGHDAGDRALRSFAAALTANLRPEDLIARWGGEEFLVVLLGCDERCASEAMNRVRRQLATTDIEGATEHLTVSIGIAVRTRGEAFEQVVGRADRALHQAKDNGRNRVTPWRADLRPPAGVDVT